MAFLVSLHITQSPKPERKGLPLVGDPFLLIQHNRDLRADHEVGTRRKMYGSFKYERI